MLIVHLVSSLEKLYGGTSSSVARLCEGLSCAGYDVACVSSGSEQAHLPAFNVKNFIISKESSFFSKIVHFLFVYNSLSKVGCKQIFHIHGLWSPELWPVILMLVLQRKKWIFSPHGMLSRDAFIVSYYKKRLCWLLFLKFFVSRASFVAVCSESEHVDVLHFVNSRIVVIPNIVDSPRLCHDVERSESLKILCRKFEISFTKLSSANICFILGRVTRIKNIEVCIKALSVVENRNTLLIISGPVEPNYFQELNVLINSFNLIDRVLFTGEVDGIIKDHLFNISSVLLFSSHKENFGMVVIEALARGVPVITSPGTPWQNLCYHSLGVEFDGSSPDLAFWIDFICYSNCLNKDRVLENSSSFLRSFSPKSVSELYVSSFLGE